MSEPRVILWNAAPEPTAIQLTDWNEETVRTAVESLPRAVAELAIKRANQWLYERTSASWDHWKRIAAEAKLEEDNWEKWQDRRQAWIKHVLAYVFPLLRDTLTPELVPVVNAPVPDFWRAIDQPNTGSVLEAPVVPKRRKSRRRVVRA